MLAIPHIYSAPALVRRSAQVDGALSSLRPIDAGVPQGSVLRPVVYLVYVNNLLLFEGVMLSLHEDDAMYHTSLLNIRFVSTMIKCQLNLLLQWHVVICIKRKQDTSVCLPLSLEGNLSNGRGQ